MTQPVAHRPQRGFSLLEMMIAIIIGMFSVLVIMQVLAGTATSRRIAIGGGDAQMNSVAAVRALELDMEQAGLGLQSYNISGCSMAYTTSQDSAAVTLPALAPVTVNPATTVVPAGDANTDTLLIMSGSSPSPSEGDLLTSATTSTAYVVTTPTSFFIGDQVVAAAATRASPCALQLAKVTGISGSALTVTSGAAGLPTGSIAYNLGGTPSVHAFAVRSGDLVMCDYLMWNCGSTGYTTTLNRSVWVPVASNIVSLRAQYAKDTSGITGSVSVMDGVIDRFDQTTPAATDAIALYCGWARVIGVRMAVVARGQQFDKNLTYTTASTYLADVAMTKPPPTVLQTPTWDGTNPVTAVSSTQPQLNPVGVPITLTATDANWQRYRYTTVQTMIPLRNAIWQGSQPTYQGGAGAC